MASIWNETSRQTLLDRFPGVRPDATPRWGRLDAVHMLAHVVDGLRLALGDLPCRPMPSVVRLPVLKQLVVYALPFPRDVPTAPELIARAAGPWQVELADLERLARRLAELPPGHRLPDHPIFGRLSRRAWGVLIYRHMDHHLRQFGA